jgi:hypothetical protein
MGIGLIGRLLARECGCCLTVNLRTKTLREIKGNIGPCKSDGQDFKRD